MKTPRRFPPARGFFIRLAMSGRSWFDADAIKGLKYGLLFGAAALLLILAPRFISRTAPSSPPAPQVRSAPARDIEIHRHLDFSGHAASPAVQRLARWVVASADNGDRFFAILDKKNARVFLFQPGGKLLDTTPVLLGYAAGDDSVTGIGNKPIAEVRPQERSTPAGRFVAEPGRNADNEEVLWIDYEAAVSMHRLRISNIAERRAERLASPTAADNRISYGCVNVPPAFFEQTLWPSFRGRGGIVYVLPEKKSLTEVFPALASSS